MPDFWSHKMFIWNKVHFFLLHAGLTFSCGRCLVPEFGEFLLDSRGGGGRESKVILTFVSSSAMIILVDKDDHLENYDKYHQRRDLVELTTQQERFVDQEKKVIVINVTMLVLSVFSAQPPLWQKWRWWRWQCCLGRRARQLTRPGRHFPWEGGQCLCSSTIV